MSPRTITFKDLLLESVEVDGLMLEASITVTVAKCGDGSFEIEFWDMGDVYLMTPQYDGIKLDISDRHLLHQRFKNECELQALRRAAEAHEYEYDEIEEFAV